MNLGRCRNFCLKGWKNWERASSACQAVVEIGMPAVTRVHQACSTTADRACYLLFSIRTGMRCCALPVADGCNVCCRRRDSNSLCYRQKKGDPLCPFYTSITQEISETSWRSLLVTQLTNTTCALSSFHLEAENLIRHLSNSSWRLET